MKTLTKSEKTAIRCHVAALYAARGGRRVQIKRDGGVYVTVDGNGSQVVDGQDISGGQIFAGWASDLLREAKEAREVEGQ